MPTNNHNFVFDAKLEFKDAGLVAADAAAQVDGADKIVDLGGSNKSYVRGVMVIDATAVEVASGDERYDIVFELSNSATFASGIVARAILPLGDTVPLSGDTDNGAARYTLFVDNEHAGATYRYARLYTDVSGTIATGVNYTAFFCPE